MPGFYERERRKFRLFGEARWRTPQLGGLAAAASHWTLDPRHPAVVSIPTGAGKTALAMAAPFVTPRPPRRVLVVVPSADLRRQTVERFSSQKDLLAIKALGGVWDQAVKVKEVESMIESWDDLRAFDVVVALPNTISPHHYSDRPPPRGLFDLVIVDEAHHVSATTWLAILEHFSEAYCLLLTATPARRDGRRIPGKHVYHYPLRLALESGIYKPVDPILLEPGRNRRDSDRLIADRCGEILRQERHRSSTLVVRADSIERADALVELYSSVGIRIEPVHGRVGQRQRMERVAELANGSLRGVAVVGMLGEGFDLPSIRLLAYHDKHKSVPATVQIIGRLARVSREHPQPSHLVTVRDIDVFPELQGIIRDLYQEDPDWLTVLPRVVDEEIAEDQANAEFASRFVAAESEIDPRHLWPLLRSVVYEVERRGWKPFFALGQVPAELMQGRMFAGGEIVFAKADAEQAIFVLVVRHTTTPTWTTDRAVQNVEYALHLAALRKAPRGKRDLLFINADNDAGLTLLGAHLELDAVAKPVGPELVDGWVNSLERHSVSAVGVRNVNAAGRGTVGYKNYLGSGVHRGLRAADTHRAALGHGNLQIALDERSSTNAGFAVEKSKIWFQRYEPLRTFVGWVADASNRFWHPTVSASGPLLPGIDRGRRMVAWPASRPIAIEMNARVFGESLTVTHRDSSYSLEEVELRFVEPPFVDGRGGALQFEAVVPGSPEEPESAVQIWRGTITTDGTITSDGSLAVARGYAPQQDFTQVLRSHPPTVFFLNGSTAVGHLLYDSRGAGAAFEPTQVVYSTWQNVDIQAETRRTATRRGNGVSVHEHLEGWLLGRQRNGTARWVFLNDGSGEIADYIVVEPLQNGEVHMELWHAKPANGSAPSVRVDDLEKVVAQAIKSRRWIKSQRLWTELAERYQGEATPKAVVVTGSDDENLLRVHLGLAEGAEDIPNWLETNPVVRGRICIAQPGLSYAQFATPGAQQEAAADGIRNLLTVFRDTALADALDVVILGSA